MFYTFLTWKVGLKETGGNLFHVYERMFLNRRSSKWPKKVLRGRIGE